MFNPFNLTSFFTPENLKRKLTVCNIKIYFFDNKLGQRAMKMLQAIANRNNSFHQGGRSKIWLILVSSTFLALLSCPYIIFKTWIYLFFLITGLVVFSLVFGVAIAAVGEDGKPILNFFSSLVSVMMKVTSWVIAIAPVGVLFLYCL